MSSHTSVFFEESTKVWINDMEEAPWPLAFKLQDDKGTSLTLFLQPAHVNKILEALEPYALAKLEESEEKTCGNLSCEDGRREGG